MSFPPAVEVLIHAGLTPNEAIRVYGGKCTGGPLEHSSRRAWAKLPFVGGSVAHFWTRLPHEGLGECATMCGLRGRETDRVPLFSQGNFPRCARCVASAQKRRLA